MPITRGWQRDLDQAAATTAEAMIDRLRAQGMLFCADCDEPIRSDDALVRDDDTAPYHEDCLSIKRLRDETPEPDAGEDR